MTSYPTGWGSDYGIMMDHRVRELQVEYERLLQHLHEYRTLLTRATDTLEVLAEIDDRALNTLKSIYKTSDEYYDSVIRRVINKKV